MRRRPSQHAANVAYYRLHRDREIARVKTRQVATVAFLRDLRHVPCADCGGLFEPHQMDFDHRDPTAKRFGLTTGRAMLASRANLLAELEKCDVVCAVCHRHRTREQHQTKLANTMRRGSSPYLARKRTHWRLQAHVLDTLRKVPCADCGRRYPPYAMDFDHVEPSTKRDGVTRMIGRSGIRRILAEAAKCDIVCANCHRARTYRRRLKVAIERE